MVHELGSRGRKINNQQHCMKKLILIAVITLGALVTFGPLAQAAEGDAPAKKGKARADAIEMYKKELNLSEAQVEKLKPVLEAQAKAMREATSDSNMPREERRAKQAKVREEYLPKIKAILTKEQGDKLDKLNAERKAKQKQ